MSFVEGINEMMKICDTATVDHEDVIEEAFEEDDRISRAISKVFGKLPDFLIHCSHKNVSIIRSTNRTHCRPQQLLEQIFIKLKDVPL